MLFVVFIKVVFLDDTHARFPSVDTLQRGVQWIGGAVDWGSII